MLDLTRYMAPYDPPRTGLVDVIRYWVKHIPNDVALYFTDGDEGSEEKLTYAELDLRARAVAAEIQRFAEPGDRGILMFPPGLEFVVGFFGCLYAGCIAVPAFPPRRNKRGSRIAGIAADCQATFILSVDNSRQLIESEEEQLRVGKMQLITTDSTDKQQASQFNPVAIDPSHLAVLQYTSGSTGRPKGVMLSHANLIRNAELITVAFGHHRQVKGASWLPAYHDMGLIGGILNPLYLGRSTVLMSPMSFLQKPVRWLRMISNYRVTTTGGPNFAYQLCVDKVTDEEMQGLDLSSWEVAFNGAEPVRASTLAQFSEKFGCVGFTHKAHFPCYGMAETTLIVTGGPARELPVVETFDSRQLDARVVASATEDSDHVRQLVGCGTVLPGETICIVDLDTYQDLPEGRIGEIWVQSPSVGLGYWEKAEETQSTFGGRLSDGRGPFLRTGDLGFFDKGQLFIAGRVKDLIIVRGVNRYPQDIEQTVEECHESIPSCAAAAFADSTTGREKLIIAVEVQRSLEDDWEPVIHTIRRSVTQVHELPPDAVYLVRFGSLPKTSSGKIQRHACLRDYLDGNLKIVAKWESWQEGLYEQAPMIAAAVFDGSGGSGRYTPKIGKKSKDPNPQIVELVKKAIKTVAQERAKSLELDTNIVLDLGLDSLERLQISHMLESAFGGRFPEEVLQEIETVREVAEALETHFGKDRMQTSAALDLGTTEELERTIGPEDYEFDKLPEYRRLKQTMVQFELSGLPNPYFSAHQGITRDTTMIDGREMISFASYNYLGMSGDQEVSDAVVNAVKKYGTSVSASRLVAGEKDIHRKLEMALANWVGAEDSVVLVGGHSTNETVIGHMVGPGDLILHDALSHNSIVQGAILSGARRRPFPHNDWQALDEALTQLRRKHRRVLVIVEGVYSMDGDYPELPKFIEVKKKHKCWLMVDEAHSIGTMGKTGRGIGEHFGVDPREVDVWMGTLSKSFGSCGGYIAGSKSLVENLKYTAPGFVFSVGLSPPNTAAALKSVEVLSRQPERVERLREMSALFLSEARKRGLNTGHSHDTPVVPIIIGNSMHALQLSHMLYKASVNVLPILYPAVEESAARLRFFINCTHSKEQIMFAVEKTAEYLKKIAPELFRYPQAPSIASSPAVAASRS